MIKDSMLIEAIDENPDCYYRYLAAANNFKIFEREKYSYVISGKNVWGNNIFGMKNINKDLIRELKKKICAKEMPSMVSPGMKNTNTLSDELFLTEGFQRKDTLYGMALENNNFKYEKHGNGLVVKKCEKIEEFVLWSEIVVTYLLKKNGIGDVADYAGIAYNASIKNKKGIKYTAFIGYYEGAPAATSACFVENGTGGIYCVAVPDKFRGKGFGYEITAVCVNEGIKCGVSSYVLLSTNDGRNVYKKLGFEEMNIVNRYMIKAANK